MPSKVVTAHTTAVEVAAERKNACHYPTSITIDNDAGAADRVIRLQDVFTPSETHGDDDPDEATVERWRATVLQGSVDTFSKEDLKGIKALGALKAIGDAVDTDCHITVGYETR